MKSAKYLLLFFAAIARSAAPPMPHESPSRLAR